MPKNIQLARQLRRDVVTDNAMESFVQITAQRKIQAEQESNRMKEERKSRLKE